VTVTKSTGPIFVIARKRQSRFSQFPGFRLSLANASSAGMTAELSGELLMHHTAQREKELQ
jgi:hypothetical protein